MPLEKEHIIAQLQKDILALQGFRSAKAGYPSDMGLGEIVKAFPNQTFPHAAVHEFVAQSMEEVSASAAFIAALLSPVLQAGGVLCWIGSKKIIFPGAFIQFGITPQQVIFIDPLKKKDIAWVAEEALQCEALSAVVAEWSELSFVESRRLQLAVEKSQVTGCILRRSPKQLNTTAAVSRWKISPLPSTVLDDLPGIGFPKWHIELLKVRNGKPGSWIMEWVVDRLQQPAVSGGIVRELSRKTG